MNDKFGGFPNSRNESKNPQAQNEKGHINFEQLDLASDEQLEIAYKEALAKAHDAPRELHGGGSQAWARFANEASRIGSEVDRRKNLKREKS